MNYESEEFSLESRYNDLEPQRKDLPKLYAKDKSGRIKEWSAVIISKPDGTAIYTLIYGLQDGRKTTTDRPVVLGKNIGKSNETTCFGQACFDAQSQWNKKYDKGYRTSIDSLEAANEVEYFLPMLALRYDERGKDIKFPAHVQPKLDGFRCLARKRDGKVTMWSRAGKPFSVVSEIITELEKLMIDDEVYDGEIYRHDWRNPEGEADFQRIASAVKKRNDDTSLLQYHVYDRPQVDVGFVDRYLNGRTQVETERIKWVKTKVVNNEAEMTNWYEELISGDFPYEGLMIRNSEGLYLYGAHKSKDLQKVKPFEDGEFEIIGGQEAVGDDAGTVVFKCMAENGKEFDVRPMGSRETRREWWENLEDYVGKVLTVRFNGRSNSGAPRFPRGLHVRPEWDIDEPAIKARNEEAKNEEIRAVPAIKFTTKSGKLSGGLKLSSLLK
jgi:ATP-dependent DNA ligase